jgi:hypothetical protein
MSHFAKFFGGRSRSLMAAFWRRLEIGLAGARSSRRRSRKDLERDRSKPKPTRVKGLFDEVRRTNEGACPGRWSSSRVGGIGIGAKSRREWSPHNFRTIHQNCGNAKLTFQPAIAEDLASKIRPGKIVRLVSSGSYSNQVVADEYERFLVGRGFRVERSINEMMPRASDFPIIVNDMGSDVIVVIAPSAR